MSEARPITKVENLANQWARDVRGNLISARECAIGVSYACPRDGCGRELRVRAADSILVRPHLAHVSDCSGSGESFEHRLAKELVVQRIREFMAGQRRAPFLGRLCPSHPDIVLHGYPLAGVTAVDAEQTLGPRRVDVLVRRGESRPLAIEVHVTHAVDTHKANDLDEHGVDWLEIDAASVLDDGVWHYHRSSGFERLCQLCTYETARQRAEDEARRYDQLATEAAAVSARAASEQRAAEMRVKTAQNHAEQEEARLRALQERVKSNGMRVQLAAKLAEDAESHAKSAPAPRGSIAAIVEGAQRAHERLARLSFKRVAQQEGISVDFDVEGHGAGIVPPMAMALLEDSFRRAAVLYGADRDHLAKVRFDADELETRSGTARGSNR